MKKETEQGQQTQIVKPLRRGAQKSVIPDKEAAKAQKKKKPQTPARPKIRLKSPAEKEAPKLEKQATPEQRPVPPVQEAQEKQPHKEPAQTELEKPDAKSDIPDALMEEAFGKRESKSSQKTNAFKQCTAKCFAPLDSALENIHTDFADRSPARKAFIAMLKLKAPICILLVIVIALSGAFFLLRSRNTATTEMSLNYEESAYGLNPNSTRYNVYNIASREVVQSMLTYCGADPEAVDINALCDSISINPTNKKAFNEETLFITTTYKITLSDPPRIKGVSTQEMLSFLCKAYKDFLYSNYTENRSILSFDIDRFDDEEFLEIADLLDLKAQQIEKYLNTRVKQSKTFTEKESDESFKSLSQKVEDLRNYDIAKYRAFVIEAGCSHDKARFLRSLSYINRMKQIDYDKDISAYNVHNAGIKMYDEAMISVVMIPSIDESKNTYYMSKTKTGMDYMAKQADDYLLTAQETAKEIKVNHEIMNKMQAGTNSNSDIQKATGMIQNIREKFAKLSGQIETVDKAYIKYKTKDYLTFKDAAPSVLQRVNLTALAVIAVLLIAGIYAVLLLRFRYLSGGNQK